MGFFVKSNWGCYKYLFFCVLDVLCHSRKGKFTKFNLPLPPYLFLFPITFLLGGCKASQPGNGCLIIGAHNPPRTPIFDKA